MNPKVALVKVLPKSETPEVFKAVNIALEMMGGPGESGPEFH
jgi:hypothetical protein